MSTPTPSAARPASLNAILAYAWDAGEFTATDAIEATGLTRSTTIEAMDALARLGLLEELPNARVAGNYRKGRPARRFSLRAGAAVLVGVDAGNTHLTVTVSDLCARTLATRRDVDAPEAEAGADRVARVIRLIDAALADSDHSRADVLSICVGVPAPVDARGHSPAHRDGFWERMNPGLVDALDWAPLVRIDNDASLAAVAEGTIGGARDCGNYIALLAGDRLGAGVVVDGHLLRGAHGGVGEMIAFAHVEGVGSADGLGSRLVAWVDAARTAGTLDPASALSRTPAPELTGQSVLELAAAGDPDARAAARHVGGVLARIVSVLGSMFDPHRVVVSGAISHGIDEVVSAARLALPTDLDLPAPEIVVSTLGGDVVAAGAVCGASVEARERALDVWPPRPTR